MTVRERRRIDNGETGVTGWKMIVALVIIAATAVSTLWITRSTDATTAIVMVLLLPLGIYATR